MCVARVRKYCCNRRKRDKLAKQAQGDKQIQKREARRDGEKRGGDTNTENAEFDTIVCWRETKKPNPTITVVQLTYCDSITVRIQRTALSFRGGGGQRKSEREKWERTE